MTGAVVLTGGTLVTDGGLERADLALDYCVTASGVGSWPGRGRTWTC